MNEETITIDKETALNVTCWDWGQLKENPDSIDWIPALMAVAKLSKIVNKQMYGVNYDE
ncbi:MAG: hypothetical protein PHW03_09040 [Eubacteriales bacterium]|nr:hypothetical protein [Eubacteriales bacterium]